MTCVVYKDGLLMGDGFIGDTYIKTGSAKKVYKVQLNPENAIYWTGSGDCGYDDMFSQYLVESHYSPVRAKELRKEYLEAKADWEAFTVSPKGFVELYDDRWAKYICENEYFASGAGEKFALGALATGLVDAIGAIQAAIKVCTHVSYPLQGFNVKTGEEIILKSEREVANWRKEQANVSSKPL